MTNMPDALWYRIKDVAVVHPVESGGRGKKIFEAFVHPELPGVFVIGRNIPFQGTYLNFIQGTYLTYEAKSWLVESCKNVKITCQGKTIGHNLIKTKHFEPWWPMTSYSQMLQGTKNIATGVALGLAHDALFD